MHNIWTIFKNDLRSLGKCFFACVVAVAIALLPSLYAWLNIYSNWDPYGNTGGISIAVASLDEGYTDENGCYENRGDAVVEDLRNATSINWVIVDTEQEAKQGVEAGDYYAAVVIDRQFTRNMYRMLTDWTGKPAITYYENAKKNAVATKITDTAVETLKRSISENYLEVVISSIMEEEKPNQREKPAFRDERITKLIPKSIPRGQETDFVVKALEFYNRHLQRNKAHER